MEDNNSATGPDDDQISEADDNSLDATTQSSERSSARARRPNPYRLRTTTISRADRQSKVNFELSPQVFLLDNAERRALIAALKVILPVEDSPETNNEAVDTLARNERHYMFRGVLHIFNMFRKLFTRNRSSRNL